MLDRLDLQILDALQRDSALSMVDLGAKVGLSSTPCWKRVKRLEDSGHIDKRVAIINRKAVGLPITVFVSIQAGQMWASRKSARIAAKQSKRIRHHANLRSLLVLPGARHTFGSATSKQPRSSTSCTTRLFLVRHIVPIGPDGSRQMVCGFRSSTFETQPLRNDHGAETWRFSTSLLSVESHTSESSRRSRNGVYTPLRVTHHRNQATSSPSSVMAMGCMPRNETGMSSGSSAASAL